MYACVRQELQRECRQLLHHEDLLRAQRRHELAIKRQNDEIKQRQIEENKHIIVRYVISVYQQSLQNLVVSLKVLFYS